MNKAVIYSAAAVVMGLLLTLVPLFTLAEFRVQENYAGSFSITDAFKSVERTDHDLARPRYSVADFEVLILGFAIALVVYALFKFKLSH